MSGRTRRGRQLPDVVELVLEQLIAHPDGLQRVELVRHVGRTSAPTVQRALTTLREEHGAPIVFDALARKWVLTDPSFRLPVDAPEPDDVRAVLIAEAILEPVADAALRDRLRRLAEQLDDRVRRRPAGNRASVRGAVLGRATLGTRIDTRHLQVLLDANGRRPIRLVYLSCPLISQIMPYASRNTA